MALEWTSLSACKAICLVARGQRVCGCDQFVTNGPKQPAQNLASNSVITGSSPRRTEHVRSGGQVLDHDTLDRPPLHRMIGRAQGIGRKTCTASRCGQRHHSNTDPARFRLSSFPS